MTKKKDKILPIKVWLDADSCWTEKPQGDGYVEYVHEDYHAEAMLCAFHRGIEKGKKKMLNKACNWLSLNLQMLLNVFDVEYNTNDTKTKDFIDDFKKAMEDAK